MAAECTYAWTSGPAFVTWYPGAGYTNCVASYGTAVKLGYSEDGVRHRFQFQWDRVSGDDFGGHAGPPADLQLFGGFAEIDLTLTKFSAAIATIEPLITMTATAGTLPKFGAFMRQDYIFGKLELKAVNKTITYPMCQLIDENLNWGSRHRKWQLRFHAHMDTPCARIVYALATGSDPCA